MPITALFFDVGNTLLFPNRERMLRSLHARKVFPSEELLRKVERQTKPEFDALLENHAAVDHGFWQMYYSHLLEDLGLSDESICSDLVSCPRVSANWCDIRPSEAWRRLAERYRFGDFECGWQDCRNLIAAESPMLKNLPTRG